MLEMRQILVWVNNMENYFAGEDANGNKLPANFNWTPSFSFKAGWDDYSSAFEFGEAPENLLL